MKRLGKDGSCTTKTVENNATMTAEPQKEISFLSKRYRGDGGLGNKLGFLFAKKRLISRGGDETHQPKLEKDIIISKESIKTMENIQLTVFKHEKYINAVDNKDVNLITVFEEDFNLAKQAAAEVVLNGRDGLHSRPEAVLNRENDLHNKNTIARKYINYNELSNSNSTQKNAAAPREQRSTKSPTKSPAQHSRNL